jgi:hypothetical protein
MMKSMQGKAGVIYCSLQFAVPLLTRPMPVQDAMRRMSEESRKHKQKLIPEWTWTRLRRS